MHDWRTDNWAGRRPPTSNPNNLRFPRSAREAGFYYGPYKKDHSDTIVVLLLLFIVGVLLWLV
jgi:hypothetical protein